LLSNDWPKFVLKLPVLKSVSLLTGKLVRVFQRISPYLLAAIFVVSMKTRYACKF